MQGIYSIRHLASGNCYVGSSGNLSLRWSQHKSAIRKGKHPAKHMMHAFQKYGSDAFTFEVLEECDVSDNAARIERENHWIAKLKPVFNLAPVAGSNQGYKHTAETKTKMLASRTPELRAAISRAQTGRVKSLEEITRLSASLMGRVSPRKGVTLSEETKAKISKNRTGIARSAEASAAAAASNAGRKRTDEQRARMCAAQKGRTFSDETKARMSLAALAYNARKREAQALTL
jgi:group I intron endonuclease